VAAVQSWLSDLATRLGVEEVGTDDLNTYKQIASEMG